MGLLVRSEGNSHNSHTPSDSKCPMQGLCDNKVYSGRSQNPQKARKQRRFLESNGQVPGTSRQRWSERKLPFSPWKAKVTWHGWEKHLWETNSSVEQKSSHWGLKANLTSMKSSGSHRLEFKTGQRLPVWDWKHHGGKTGRKKENTTLLHMWNHLYSWSCEALISDHNKRRAWQIRT